MEYLSSMPLDFDYYVALDVFIYVGELTEIFRLIKSRNKKTWALVFSTEHAKGWLSSAELHDTHIQKVILKISVKIRLISHFSTNDDFLTGGIYVLSFKPKKYLTKFWIKLIIL